jgi:hypothetical protein
LEYAVARNPGPGCRKIRYVVRMKRKVLVFITVMITVFTFVYVEGRNHGPATPSVPAHIAINPNETWIVGRSSIQQMLQNGASPTLIKQAFDNNHTFVYDTRLSDAVTTSRFGIPTITFGSFGAIQRAFENGTLPGAYKAVLYDNERWSATPLIEQQHPVHYMQLTARLLHRHGMLYIATPAPDLMWAVGRPANSYNAFLRARIPAAAAKYADILDLQAQVKETNLAAYTAFVRSAAEQARAANPHIKIVVGIRTNPGALPMLAAFRATSSVGEGYWLNINGIPSPAIYLLQHLYSDN